MNRYEDDEYYYVRKPHGIPTTVGSQFSFIEQIEKEHPSFFQELTRVWKQEEERGLLNRLDNETAGLLYFAKTPAIAEAYYRLQEEEKIIKWYVCDVKGDMNRFVNTQTYVTRTHHPVTGESALCVSAPVMHHIHDDQKMIIVRQPDDKKKGRGKEHAVKTYFIPLYYDVEKDITTAYALIAKGIRHQIRVHASSIGYPLVGDLLYKGYADEHLHLRSVGLSASDK